MASQPHLQGVRRAHIPHHTLFRQPGRHRTHTRSPVSSPDQAHRRALPLVLQSTDQFFHFPLLWTTQYTARSTAPSTYKNSTCACTSCPAHIIFTASPTCLQPIPYRPPSSIRCHRLLRATPRLCPATAASGKPASPTSATFRRRDVQPHPRR